MNLTNKVLIALLLGITIGLALNFFHLSEVGWINTYFINGIFTIVGKLFINALKMLVVPLVLFSIISGVVGLQDVRRIGKVGGITFLLYMLTTVIAIATAVALAVLSGVGSGSEIATHTEKMLAKPPALLDSLLNIVPANIFVAMSQANMMAIIFFAMIFGISLLSVASKAEQVVSFVEQMNHVIGKMVMLVMHVAPYAVFCLIAKSVANLGLDVLWQLANYMLVVFAALAWHVLINQMLLLKILTGLNPWVFLRKMRTAQLFAFSTASTSATMPVTMRTLKERLGVDNAIASFNVPFGATINMDGTAIMQGVATVFFANLYGLELGLSGYTIVIVLALLASIGTAAVPSVGLVMLAGILVQVGLPVEAIGIIYGVDRLVDMVRTAVNVTGDGAVGVIVAKREGLLNDEIYHDISAGEFKDDTH